MRPGAPSMQQGGCCDDALVDGGGVTAAADMPLLESTSRMSKNCGPIVENHSFMFNISWWQRGTLRGRFSPGQREASCERTKNSPGATVAAPHDGVRVERSPTHTLQVREDRTREESRSQRLQVEVFGARERATASPSAARQHMRLVVPLCRPILGLRPHLERL